MTYVIPPPMMQLVGEWRRPCLRRRLYVLCVTAMKGIEISVFAAETQSFESRAPRKTDAREGLAEAGRRAASVTASRHQSSLVASKR